MFLPGVGEIRRTAEALAGLAAQHDFDVLPLHGELSWEDQARAVDRRSGPHVKRKVILSTNVAETSVTVDGVTWVIDSGLARVAMDDPFSGMPTLSLAPISQAAAIQRTGRAGRTAPGRCVRLYSEPDFRKRRAHERPEIQRMDFTSGHLMTARLAEGFGRGGVLPSDFWFEAPPSERLADASQILRMIGALDGTGRISPAGQRHAGLSHPSPSGRRDATSHRAWGAHPGCLRRGDIGRTGHHVARAPRAGRHGDGPGHLPETLDLTAWVEALENYDGQGRQHARRFGLDPQGANQACKVAASLMGPARRLARRAADPGHPKVDDPDVALAQAVFAGYPDRLLCRREAASTRGPSTGSPSPRGPSTRGLLMRGGEISLGVVPKGGWLVVPALHQQRGRTGVGGGGAGPRPGAGGGAAARAKYAVEAEAEWPLEYFPDAVETFSEDKFNPTTHRVETTSGLKFGALTLDSQTAPASPSPAVSAKLYRAAKGHGWHRFAPGSDPDFWTRLQARIAMVVGNSDAHFDLEAYFEKACDGFVAFRELQDGVLTHLVLEALPDGLAGKLKQMAPETVTLPCGRTLQVHYETDKPLGSLHAYRIFSAWPMGPGLRGARCL